MMDEIIEARPAPWKWYWRQEDGEANCGIMWMERKGHAVSICRAPRYENKEQWEAHARLICMSPQLLLIAKRALEIETDPLRRAHIEEVISIATYQPSKRKN